LGQLSGASLLWFLAFYSRVRPSAFLWLATALFAVNLVANEVRPFGLNYADIPTLELVFLPWGETVTGAAESVGFWWYSNLVGTLLPLAFGLWCAFHLWQRERRGSAVSLALALTVFFTAVSGALEPLVGVFPTAELAFLSLVLIMTYSMVSQVTQAGFVRRALLENRQRLGAILETAPEAIFLMDGNTGEALVANALARKLFGLAPEAVTSFKPVAAATPEQVEGEPSAVTFERELLTALAGRRARFPWVVRAADGADVSCEALMVRLPGIGMPLIRLSLVDMRDLEAAQAREASLEEQLRQSQKLEAVGRLTGEVAHDFNNFLTVMQGSLELLEEGELDEVEAQEVMKEAWTAAQRSRQLTDHLLSFSRRQPPILRTVRLSSSIDGVGVLLRRTLGAHIDVRYDTPEGLWPVKLDPALLESAVVNLAINAADAMQDGGRLTLGARNVIVEDHDYHLHDELPPGRYVRVHVTDTGHGIDEETLVRVLEPFFTTKEVGKGTGLGLSMAAGFASQSGGTLRIESEVGDGTVVHMYFPEEVGELPGVPAEA
jgi:signal transduction histidine kinase